MVVLTTSLALAGNQDVANQIAQNLRDSGKMNDYRIAVKFQDGTAWLQGHVTSQSQMNAAMKIVYQTEGVTRVVNDLSVNGSEDMEPAQAQKLPSSYVPAPVQTVSGEEPRVLPRLRVAQKQTRSYGQQAPMPLAMNQQVQGQQAMPAGGAPRPMYNQATQGGVAPARYDQPCMPNYAWPSYAAYPNYAAVTYPKQYSPTAWPYIGPFYPYPQVPMGWRKVTLQWDDGWWFLDFRDEPNRCWHR
jgi:DNA-binding transcriptional regulator YdaS (Cro superfamily)